MESTKRRIQDGANRSSTYKPKFRGLLARDVRRHRPRPRLRRLGQDIVIMGSFKQPSTVAQLLHELRRGPGRNQFFLDHRAQVALLATNQDHVQLRPGYNARGGVRYRRVPPVSVGGRVE